MKYCRKEDDVFYHTVMTKTKTKCIKDPTYAIFLKSRGSKDIKYDIQTRPDQCTLADLSRICVLVKLAMLVFVMCIV